MRIAVGLALALLISVPAVAAERWEGIWAETEKECLDNEGPNSRTFIDLTNRESGKTAPLFDQYENHCSINRVTKSRDSATLRVTCFEFWEYYKKRQRGSQRTVRLVSQDWMTLAIDGKSYRRCAK